jgi:hypothetical protein
MGGYGSGWNRPKKATVEDALTLSITGLMRDGVIVPGEVRTRARGWCVNGRLVALFVCDSDAADPENAWLRLTSLGPGPSESQCIRLETTRPHWGGLRWWFICPLTGRRATKLHLPPGARLFAHRDAHGLTYRSCQESGRFRSRCYRSIAARLGLSEAELREALHPVRLRQG